MGPARRFALIFAPEVVLDLRAVERKYHSLLRREIAAQLKSNPQVEARNRKALVDLPEPYDAHWELRLGPKNRFRVFYEVDEEALVVTILAIGVKDRDVLRIGREEYGR
ncbi:MAG: type II toxin-antitoxin system RelE/ParE family toxin [Anaerolineales bacterium]|nr:type II toxin-antitoxin system RelE/ParE family toxin [Anaerolineales bacterium]